MVLVFEVYTWPGIGENKVYNKTCNWYSTCTGVVSCEVIFSACPFYCSSICVLQCTVLNGQKALSPNGESAFCYGEKQAASRPYCFNTDNCLKTYANNLRIAIPVLLHSNGESDFHLLSTISQQHGCCYVDVHRKLRHMKLFYGCMGFPDTRVLF